MTNKHDLMYFELLKRSVTAFEAALQGPDPDGADCDAPMMDQYLIVLQGQKMNLQGWADGHPRLGTTLIQTSLLIYVTEDGRWARTLSRWYQLGDAQQLDDARMMPDTEPEGISIQLGPNSVSVPLVHARRILELQPAHFARIAEEKGFQEVHDALSEIRKSWPPSF